MPGGRGVEWRTFMEVFEVAFEADFGGLSVLACSKDVALACAQTKHAVLASTKAIDLALAMH